MSGKGDYGHFTMCVFPCKAIQSLLNAVLSRITLSLIDFLRLPPSSPGRSVSQQAILQSHFMRLFVNYVTKESRIPSDL